MPFKSDAQRKFFNVPANRKKLEAQGVDVGEWNQSSKGLKLPAKASHTKGSRMNVTQLAVEKMASYVEQMGAGIKTANAGVLTRKLAAAIRTHGNLPAALLACFPHKSAAYHRTVANGLVKGLALKMASGLMPTTAAAPVKPAVTAAKPGIAPAGAPTLLKQSSRGKLGQSKHPTSSPDCGNGMTTVSKSVSMGALKQPKTAGALDNVQGVMSDAASKPMPPQVMEAFQKLLEQGKSGLQGGMDGISQAIPHVAGAGALGGSTMLGAGLGGALGAAGGAVEGDTPRGMGRGIIRGGAAGLGAAAGGMGGAHLGQMAGQAMGNSGMGSLVGAGLGALTGGAAGYAGSGAMMG